MPLPPSRCFEYETPYMQLFSESVQALMRARDPVYAQMPRETVDFVPESAVEVPGTDPTTMKPLEARSTSSLEVDSIVSGDFGSVASIIDQVAEDFLSQIMPEVFAHISAVCEATGNVVNTKGKPLSWDVVLDVLERIDIAFDDQGNAILPTIVMHPKTARSLEQLGPPTEEQERRKEAIVEQKKEQHDRRRRSRRLS